MSYITKTSTIQCEGGNVCTGHESNLSWVLLVSFFCLLSACFVCFPFSLITLCLVTTPVFDFPECSHAEVRLYILSMIMAQSSRSMMSGSVTAEKRLFHPAPCIPVIDNQGRVLAASQPPDRKSSMFDFSLCLLQFALSHQRR